MSYKVNIDGNNSLHGLDKEYFEPGEIVTFRVPFVTDCSTYVRSDEVTFTSDTNGSHREYSFVMPEMDVNVTISFEGRMCYDPNVKPFMMGGLSMMDVNPTQNTFVPSVEEGNYLICSCCKEKNRMTSKFCFNCGNPLVKTQQEEDNGK